MPSRGHCDVHIILVLPTGHRPQFTRVDDLAGILLERAA
jgi:hypothetical protein